MIRRLLLLVVAVLSAAPAVGETLLRMNHQMAPRAKNRPQVVRLQTSVRELVRRGI